MLGPNDLAIQTGCSQTFEGDSSLEAERRFKRIQQNLAARFQNPQCVAKAGMPKLSAADGPENLQHDQAINGICRNAFKARSCP
jgi:hypothetical protein